MFSALQARSGNEPALAHVVRPLVLFTMVIGIATTLVLGPSVVNPGPAGAQAGYGDVGPSGLGADKLTARSLIIGSAEPTSWPVEAVLIAAALMGLIAAVAAVVVRNRRRST